MFENSGNTGTFKRPRTKMILIGAGALVVILAVVSGFFIWQYMQLKNDPTVVAKETSQRLIDKVGKIYALPANEEPTIATVQDKEKLQNQDFFKAAQNGDYLLLYETEKIAIIYRESENKIITAGPITGADQAAQGQ